MILTLVMTNRTRYGVLLLQGGLRLVLQPLYYFFNSRFLHIFLRGGGVIRLKERGPRGILVREGGHRVDLLPKGPTVQRVLHVSFFRLAVGHQVVDQPKGDRDHGDHQGLDADDDNLQEVAPHRIDANLVEDAVNREERVLRVGNLHEDIQATLYHGGPLQVETLHQGDHLEVVGEDSYQNSLRLVSFRVIQQVAIGR